MRKKSTSATYIYTEHFTLHFALHSNSTSFFAWREVLGSNSGGLDLQWFERSLPTVAVGEIVTIQSRKC